LYLKILLSIICNKLYFYNQCRSVEPSADLSILLSADLSSADFSTCRFVFKTKCRFVSVPICLAPCCVCYKSNAGISITLFCHATVTVKTYTHLLAIFMTIVFSNSQNVYIYDIW